MPFKPISAASLTLDPSALNPDPATLRSIHEAADIPSRRPNPNAINPQVQARLRYYEALATDTAAHEAQLVNQLDTYLLLDRKAALHKLKTMPIGDIVITPYTHANNVRVACHYHNTKHDRVFRTETMKVGDARYIKVVRVE